MSVLDNINLCNDYMFFRVMSDPIVCKVVLEKILVGIKIEKIVLVEEQKVINPLLDSKGIRLDVYVKGNKGTVYNIEMQQRGKKEDLPKRSRYYQGMIDINNIEKGQPYSTLNKSFVIFICTFDPFDKGRHIYTFNNQCIEESGLILKDETTKVFLNTKGTLDDVDAEMLEFLRYIENSTDNQAVQSSSELIHLLHNRVKQVRSSKEMEVEYMTLMMRDQEIKEEGKQEGREEGREEGMEQLSALNCKLIEEKRIDDMIRVAKDKEYRKQLLREFGIE